MKPTRIVPLLATALLLPLTSMTAYADPPQQPVFEDGKAQPVFDPDDVVRDKLWVTAPVDSDQDGADDKVYVEVVRPRATERGLRVPVVYQASPYYSGGNDVRNHDVDVELYVPDEHGVRAGRAQPGKGRSASSVGLAGPRGGGAEDISWRYQDYLLSRGFAVVYAESLGSGKSTGCPTSGGRNETIGARSVIDWLNGRAGARDANGDPVRADWTTGKTAMTGVSYNGTLANAVASTGVAGLETIVPIAAISSWYDYYRENGAVVAPGGYQGEDTDVLAKYVLTRKDSDICQPVLDRLVNEQDRVTGDYSRFWHRRNYLPDAGDVRASVLAVHGLSDRNVTVSQVADWYQALRRNGVEHKIWLHQAGHADPLHLREQEWLDTINRWYSHYLYGVDNEIENRPKATIQREDGSWTEEADWPAPGTSDARIYPWPGGRERGGIDTRHPVPGLADQETLVDDASRPIRQLVDAPRSAHRLAYATGPAKEAVRLSGTPRVDLGIAFDEPAANITGALVDRAPDGTSQVITRGWADPQNRHGIDRTAPIRTGKTYRVSFELQPNDYVVPAGHKLEFVLASSDHHFTLRPDPGTGLALDLTRTSVTLPVQGGKAHLRAAFGGRH